MTERLYQLTAKNSLKLDFVREEVARFYGRNGNESVDLVIIVKRMLLLFLCDAPARITIPAI